jgi:hypothetical protein
MIHERNFFSGCFEQCDAQIRSGNPKRQPGKTRAASNVDDRFRITHDRRDRERVEKMLNQDFVVFDDRGQIDLRIPRGKLAKVGLELLFLSAGQINPKLTRPRSNAFYSQI